MKLLTLVSIVAGLTLATACSSAQMPTPQTAQRATPHTWAPARQKNHHKGLLALYSFNGTLDDSSGNGKTASDTGTPTYVGGAPFGGKAIEFDGSGTAIVTAPLNISVKAMAQLTMGGWFRSNSFSTPPYGIVSNDDGNYDRTIDLDNRDAKSGVNWSAFVGGEVVGKVPVKKGKWVFAAVAYNQRKLPGKYAFYVNNGKHTTTLKGAANFDGDSITTAVTIGSNPNFDQAFTGDAANVFFYAGVLSKKQIAQIVAKGPSAIP